MQTLEQFGQTIKQKYPQYSDIPNRELGQKMLAKYPQYSDMVQVRKSQEELRSDLEKGMAASAAADKIIKSPWQQFGSGIVKPLANIPGIKQTGQLGTAIVQGIAKPVLTAASTGLSALKGVNTLGMAGMAGLTGNKDLANRYLQEAARPVNIDLGVIGKGSPASVDEAGKQVSAAQNWKQAAGVGAQLGSLPMGAGALQGASFFGGQAMQENKNPVEIALSAGGGALGGKVLKVAGQKIGLLAEKLNLKQAQEMVMPQLDKTAKMELLQKGMMERKGIAGAFGKITPKPSAIDIENAKLAQPFLSKNPIESINNLSGEVSRVQNQEVIPFLMENNTPYGKAAVDNLIEKINKITPSETITKADKNLLRAFNIVKENAKKAVKTEVKDDVSLYKLRILLDNIGKQETKGKLFESTTAVSDAYRQIRNVFNNAITEGMPQGKANFADKLKYESKLLDVLQNISEKTQSQVGKSVFETNMALKAGKKALPLLGGLQVYNTLKNIAKGN